MSIMHDGKRWILQSLGLVPADGPVFYGNFKGRVGLGTALMKNMLRPQRLLKRLEYGQILPLPNAFLKGAPCPAELRDAASQEPFDQALKDLKRDGVALIPGYIDEDTCDRLVAEWDALKRDDIQDHPYQKKIIGPPLSPELLDIWLDRGLVGVLARYLGRLPVARLYPSFTIARPPYSQPSSRNYSTDKNDFLLAVPWHIDTPNLVQFAILMSDVTDDCSHMKILAGTHKKHNAYLSTEDAALSDEYVAQSGYNVVNCVGPKGTVVLFDAAAYHQFYAVANSPRYWLKFEFTPGNNVLFNAQTESLSVPDPALFENLPSLECKILSEMYPSYTM